METIEQLLIKNIFQVLYQKGRIDEAQYHLACQQIFARTPNERTNDELPELPTERATDEPPELLKLTND